MRDLIDPALVAVVVLANALVQSDPAWLIEHAARLAGAIFEGAFDAIR